MESEVRKLRATLARREGGRGRRFAPELRRQISAVGRRLRDEGQSWFRIGREIGLPGEAVRRLCEAAPGLVAVEIVDEAVARDLVVVAPIRSDDFMLRLLSWPQTMRSFTRQWNDSTSLQFLGGDEGP
jgi:hypothetical protein